ncbi:helix-turn-helix transcriptional regulator [Tateyamaria sp. SN3-11]|uniref:helix-turn-helix transcriptional regulator n=1 Tax=Tateyamaria sp. SN3-11 TaxID=3092147 RepID=UPI0039E7FF74
MVQAWIAVQSIQLSERRGIRPDEAKMTKKYVLPRVQLDTSNLEARFRWDAWQSLNSGLFRLERNRPAEESMYATALSYRIGSTILGEYSVSGNIVRRSVERFAVEREDLLVLRLHRSGFTKGVMGEKDLEMKSSHLTLFDFHQPFHANTENVDYVSFTFPYVSVGYDPSRHPRLMQIPIDTAIGRALRSNLELLLELLPDASITEALSLSDGLCGLLRYFINGWHQNGIGDHSDKPARAVAARCYVQDNLRNPLLDARQVSAALGVSNEFLHKVFEREGGIQQYILKQRLECALDDLANTEPQRGAVVRVARYWAFSDIAYFSRLFRKHFGFRPTDVLGTALSQVTNGSTDKTQHPNRNVTPLIKLYQRSKLTNST